MKKSVNIKNVFRAIGNTIILLVGVKGEYRKEAEVEGICNYGGQK